MKEEGVIKFNCTWIKEEPLNEEWIKELNAWRDRLYQLQLIGVTEEGIGYGNISIRFRQNTFIISGSSTGRFDRLGAEHYTRVTGYSFDENALTTAGPIIASSESLTHAAIYEQHPDINAVIHVHHKGLWKMLLDTLPATHKEVAYGTTEMAREIGRLFRETNMPQHKIFAMAGHEDGIVSFGNNLDEAGRVLLDQWKRVQE